MSARETKMPTRIRMGNVEIFVDGACSGNPGPGGWGAIVRSAKWERERSGGEPATTNNRMELMGAIIALEKLTRPRRVKLYSDSKYVIDGASKWIRGWKRNGWRTAGKEEVKNVELWQRLDAAGQRHTVEWIWVKGHYGHPENERADRLARAEILKLRRPSD